MNYTLVGAFVLLLGTVLIAGLLWLASGSMLRKKVDLYVAIEKESVAGLSLNAPVKYNGVEIGKVQTIRLDPLNPEHVRLTFAIERGTPIRQDTVAILKTQGLTGISYIELAGGAHDSAPLLATDEAPYPEIRTKPSLSARLEDVLTTVLAKVDKTSSNVDALLSDENRTAIKSALLDIAAVSHTIAARNATIDAGIVDAALTARNSARATARLGPTIDRIGPVMDRLNRSAEAVEKMGNELARAGTSATLTLDTVGGEVRQFSAGTLPEVQRLLGELSALSQSLSRLSEQLERDPSSVLRGPSPVREGPGEVPRKP